MIFKKAVYNEPATKLSGEGNIGSMKAILTGMDGTREAVEFDPTRASLDDIIFDFEEKCGLSRRRN